MTKEKQIEQIYSTGDLIVHAHYGVGKIVGIEEKELRGDITRYYVVETDNSTYWLPIEIADNARVRPIVEPDEIDKIIKTLREPPKKWRITIKAAGAGSTGCNLRAN